MNKLNSEDVSLINNPQGKKVDSNSPEAHKVIVDIEFCPVCMLQAACDELKKDINYVCPNAEVICREGRRGTFEVRVNKTIVHSRLASLAFPDNADVVDNVKNATQGKPVRRAKQRPITDCVIQ